MKQIRLTKNSYRKLVKQLVARVSWTGKVKTGQVIIKGNDEVLFTIEIHDEQTDTINFVGKTVKDL